MEGEIRWMREWMRFEKSSSSIDSDGSCSHQFRPWARAADAVIFIFQNDVGNSCEKEEKDCDDHRCVWIGSLNGMDSSCQKFGWGRGGTLWRRRTKIHSVFLCFVFSLSLYFSALLQLSPSLWSDRPITRKIGAVTVMDQCGPSPAATSVPCFENCRELQFLSLLSFCCCLWMSFLEQSQSVWSLVGWLSLALVEFVWDWKMLLLLM